MILFLAYRGGQIVGRIGGIIDRNYIEFHEEKVGFFGFFESVPDAESSEMAELETDLQTQAEPAADEPAKADEPPAQNDDTPKEA